MPTSGLTSLFRSLVPRSASLFLHSLSRSLSFVSDGTASHYVSDSGPGCCFRPVASPVSLHRDAPKDFDVTACLLPAPTTACCCFRPNASLVSLQRYVSKVYDGTACLLPAPTMAFLSQHRVLVVSCCSLLSSGWPYVFDGVTGHSALPNVSFGTACLLLVSLAGFVPWSRIDQLSKQLSE